MIKELMHDPIFLAGKSEVATKEDLQVAQAKAVMFFILVAAIGLIQLYYTRRKEVQQ